MTRDEAFRTALTRAQRPRCLGTWCLPSGRRTAVYLHPDYFRPGVSWIDVRWNVEPHELSFADLVAWRDRALPEVLQATTAVTGKPVASVIRCEARLMRDIAAPVRRRGGEH